LLCELCGLLVIADLGVVDREFRSQRDLPLIVVQRLVVQDAEYESLLVIAARNTDPHPLADARGFVREFYFHKIAWLIRWLSRLRPHIRICRLASSFVAPRQPAVRGRAAVSSE